MTLQTSHNTATTSLQRELDTLRQQQQTYKVQMRELEMGNDDLERNERAVTSSLADIETKYSRVLEEKILLEHELLDKASLEEQNQRLKDELRGAFSFSCYPTVDEFSTNIIDANEEISNLRRQLEQTRSVAAVSPLMSSPGVKSNGQPLSPISPRRSLDEDLLKTTPAPDLLLSDLKPVRPQSPESPSRLSPTPPPPRPRTAPVRENGKLRPVLGQSALLSRAGFPSTPASAIPLACDSPSSLSRSSTLPTLSPARTTTHTVHGQTFARSSGRPGGSHPSVSQTLASRSKGVQMISALRSRVQTTHQRLIPGIPRLRMGSVNGRSGPATQPISVPSAGRNGVASIDHHGHKAGVTSGDEGGRRLWEENPRDTDRSAGAQSPGWVLIQTQDDSPFPVERKDAAQDRRRASSPLSPTASGGHAPIPSAFKPLSSTSASHNGPPGGIPRRPHSRISLTGAEGSNSSTGGSLVASNSIPALLSRPSTPTFLPVPTFTHQGGPKRSTEGQVSFTGSTYNPRRSSLGLPPSKRSASPGPTQYAVPSSRAMNVSTRERPTSVPAAPPTSFGLSQAVAGQTGAFNQSRIGKPAASSGGRRSIGNSGNDTVAMAEKDKDKRKLRAGGTTNPGTRDP